MFYAQNSSWEIHFLKDGLQAKEARKLLVEDKTREFKLLAVLDMS